MSRRITKVKYEPKNAEKDDSQPAVCISYVLDRMQGADEYGMRCHEQPAPSFLKALKALRPDVETICELPSGWCAEAEIRGLTASYSAKTGIRSVTITCLRKVATAQSPVVLNTPNLPDEPRSGNEGDRSPTLSLGCRTRVDRVIAEAESYLDGTRDQIPLDLEQQQEQPEPAAAEG